METMKPKGDGVKNTAQKVALFRTCFSGLTDVYGTYDPANGRSWQVKRPVTFTTILEHLQGKCPYGVYLLAGDRTRAIVADFDDADATPPVELINKARHYRLPAYLETSKSKGFHVWIFFEEKGVKASKARLVIKSILEEIEYPEIEIFPKQDSLPDKASFGNYINAPLFGGLVPKHKTVFVDPITLASYPDQWVFLESVERVSESSLNDIIQVNDLSSKHDAVERPEGRRGDDRSRGSSFPPCAQKILRDGVSRYQRVSCFRLAVHFRKLGIPYDIAIAALKTWALKNKPPNGKGVIGESEILSQATYAYDHSYAGFGCDSPAIKPFCDPSCAVIEWRKKRETPQTGVVGA
jgi:TOTE conflict system, Archaeo-Eukaryotic Primase domain